MAQRPSRHLALIITLVTTLGLVGAGTWLFKDRIFNQTNQPNPSSSNKTFADIKNVPKGLFNYGGSTTWAPIRGQVDPAINTVWTQFQLRYTNPTTGTPGSGRGIRMLLDGELAFSQSSRNLKTTEYEEAKTKGFSLKEIPVAIDGLAIAVHPNLNIPGLTLQQLKKIYTGQINNWSEVGGPNLPITPYSRRVEDGGTVEFFLEQVLEKEKLAANVEFVFDTTSALRKVARDPSGIYYASAPEVVPQCTIKTIPLARTDNKLVPPYQEPFIPLSECPKRRNQLNAPAFQTGNYPITRRLFVIIKQNGTDDQTAGEIYANLLLTDQGQELITKAGFIRIK